jgi:hypothetical protein
MTMELPTYTCPLSPRDDKVRFRWQRGLLAESLETTVYLEPTAEAVKQHMVEEVSTWLDRTVFDVGQFSVEIKYYGEDERCQWSCHFATLWITLPDGRRERLVMGWLDKLVE